MSEYYKTYQNGYHFSIKDKGVHQIGFWEWFVTPFIYWDWSHFTKDGVKVLGLKRWKKHGFYD